MPRSKAASITACASGCSEDASAAAARARSSCSPPPRIASISPTRGRPSVSVPVLSSTICLTSRKPWKASPVRIKMPRSAASPAPRTIESGAEMPTAGIAHNQSTQARKDSALDVRLPAGEPRTDNPEDHGKRCDDKNGRRVNAQHAVNEMQNAGFQRPRVFDMSDHLAEEAAFSDCCDLHEKRASPID